MRGKKMLKCLIVDDEPLAHDVILDYASELDYLNICAQAYRPLKAIEMLQEIEVDLIFLDIQMPKLNGLQMLSLLDHQPQVIITTAYEEYALQSYDYNVADYLLKPFRLDRFIQAVEKAKHNIEKESSHLSENEYLLIKSDKKLIKVKPQEIQYVESYGNYIKIWIDDDVIVTPQTLTSFSDQLPPSDFFKIHKSFVVNKKHFTFIEGNSLQMNNGNTLAISKNYKHAFMQFIEGK